MFTLSFRNRFHLWHPIIILFIFYLRRPARLTRVNEMTPDIRSAGSISVRNSLIEQTNHVLIHIVELSINCQYWLVIFFFNVTCSGLGNAIEEKQELWNLFTRASVNVCLIHLRLIQIVISDPRLVDFYAIHAQ